MLSIFLPANRPLRRCQEWRGKHNWHFPATAEPNAEKAARSRTNGSCGLTIGKTSPVQRPDARCQNILLACSGGSKTCYCSTEIMTGTQVKVSTTLRWRRVSLRIGVFLLLALLIGILLNHLAASLEGNTRPAGFSRGIVQ